MVLLCPIIIGKKEIGKLDKETKVFYKTVSLPKHLFKILDAWGIDSEVFTKILLPMECLIQVYEKEGGAVYKITAKEFLANGQYYHFKDQREDYRAQIFCPRSFWKVDSK